MEEPTSPATEALDQLGIPYRLFLHKRPLRSLEQAAAERDLAPDQIVRSLLFRLEGDEFVLVLMAGPDQVDWQSLRSYLGVSRVTTASSTEVQEVTGYRPGQVSPFGLPQPLRLLADRHLLELEVISLGAGLPNAGLILEREAALRVLQPEIVRLR